MMKLKPSAKIRRRYILINGKKEDVEKAILDYVGTLGWAKASPVFVKHSGKGVVLAIDRKEIEKIIGSFALSEGIEVIRVASTIKGVGQHKT